MRLKSNEANFNDFNKGKESRPKEHSRPG